MANKKNNNKVSMGITLFYFSLVSVAVLATLQFMRPDWFAVSMFEKAKATAKNSRSPMDIWDAEHLCLTRVKATAPRLSVVAVDSRSSRETSPANYQIMVDVDKPGHYSSGVTRMVCKADMRSREVLIRPLEVERKGPKPNFKGFSIKNLF
ncbi:hypothetical protein HBA55_06580 [Pseudomaricurvus alkylphenolicus]|uniref:hypothetical protein n=1 Tax=Pseudomaricurvus alkylphenolicus TaxID=1306991 RepID=UPI00141F7E55|nr:hypothetical protein [Pseudomaricurvus alkylphenolicus]NIB39244.1 hypothetical protein [Pseudomaricurvus alkylphenolicus]